MEQGTKNRSRRTRQQILDLLEEFRTSGNNVKEFCSSRGITPGTFHKWQSRAKAIPVKTKKAAFAPVKVDALPDHLFAEVGVIRIYQVVSAEYLKELSK